MSIILSVYATRNVSTNRTLESRNKSNHLLIENRAYSAPGKLQRQLLEKVKEKLESHVNHVRFNRTKIQIKIF